MNNEQIDEMEAKMNKMSNRELEEYNKGLPCGLSRTRCKKCGVLTPSMSTTKLGVLTKNPNKQHPLSYMVGGSVNGVRKQINATDDLCKQCYQYHTAIEGVDGLTYN